VGKAADRIRHSLDDLSPSDRQRLGRAHRRLREAVAAYEPFLGGVLVPGQDTLAIDAASIAKAQAEVQEAEDKLWSLRERLLGWSRPASAPPAALVADWFSDEDQIYDSIPETTHS
jgi:hypothetical protein